ncbi:MAG: response regulator [Anaeromyxobacteraceae bacterium]
MMTGTETPVPRRAGDAAQCAVLIVDDDRDIRETLEEILVYEGYAVATARNGADALEKARALRPELILLDLFMPVMDGAEFRRRQRDDPDIGGIPVVVVSAAAGLEDRIQALDVAEHLEKPLKIERLFELVARYCG